VEVVRSGRGRGKLEKTTFARLHKSCYPVSLLCSICSFLVDNILHSPDSSAYSFIIIMLMLGCLLNMASKCS